MERFFSILVATFISVLGALAVWHAIENHFAKLDAEKVAAATEMEKKVAAETAQIALDEIRYEWKSEERVNPVTGEKVLTATRFSEDIGSALTFRCYGLKEKRFDILVSFPDDVDWSSYNGDYFSHMKFRVDGGDLTVMRVNRSSSSVAVPDIEETKDFEKRYAKLTALLAQAREQNKTIQEFKRIGTASLFMASIPNGTIYQQSISIDLEGIQEAIRPVLDLCGKDSI